MSEYMKTNRNPFEIRTELLHLAQKYLQNQWEANQALAKDAFLEMIKQGMVVHADWDKYAPKFYDFNDIVAKAKDLYVFVNNKQDTKI